MGEPQWKPFIPLHTTGEDDPNRQTQPAPEWLTTQAQAAWNRLEPHCKPAPHELDEFAAYCEAISEYREATALIKESGLLASDMDGNPIPNPAQNIRDSADTKLSKWATRFRR